MLWMSSVAMLLALSVGSFSPRSQRLGAAALNGTWVVISVNGRTSESASGLAITFAGARYEEAVNGTVNERGTITVNPDTNPMTIDFTITEGVAQNKTQLGIFSVTGETVTFCLAAAGATVRPADFTSARDHLLIIAKKQ